MSGVRYSSFYPSDWRSGCMGLSCEEEGFYIRVCAHFWETGMRLPLNDLDAARRVQMDVRQYRRLKISLIAKGKLHVAQDGLYNNRAEYELSAARRAVEKAQGKVRAPDLGSPRDNDDPQHQDGRIEEQGRQPARAELLTTPELIAAPIAETSPRLPGDFRETSGRLPGEVCEKTQQNQQPFIEVILSKKEEGAKAPLSNEDSTPSDECDQGETLPFELEPVNDHVSKTDLTIRKQFSQPVFEAFNAYLAMAKRAGLPEPRTMTPQMRKSIGARLRESNLDCWMEAMDNVEGSKFLQGQNDRGWCADLTWIIKPANYEKILAGNYINRDTSTEYSYGQPPRKHAILAALDDLRDRFEPIN